MPTMVDDEVLGHTLGNGKTMVLLNQSQREIDAGRDARRRPNVSVPTEDAIRLNSDGRVFSLKSRCISPVRGRSTSIQQSSRREGKCACADARNPPAPARGFNKTAQRISRYERIDRASDDDECIEHGSIERHCISHHSKAVHHGPLISRKDQEPIGGTFELAIRGFECPGRTGEVEHLKPWGNVETDSGHGRIIGKFDLSVIYRPL